MKNAIIISLMLMAFSTCTFAADKAMVRATGQAPAELPNAREQAIEDALRQAVEAGAGVEIASETETRDFQLIRDVIYVKTAGLVEKYDVIQENPNQDGLYTVRVEAIVSRADINTQIEAWKALIKRKGRPRMMVVGSVDKRPFDRRLTAEVQSVLERRGLTVIDLDMLKENQRQDAERAAKGELDPQKAALVMREAGCDYFVTVAVEGTQYEARSVHGVSMVPTDATAILKVIAVDSARLIASEVKNATFQAPTAEQSLWEVTSAVAASALQEAIRRVAAHWLEDVDYRGGAEIQIIANQFSFDQVSALVTALRQIGGIKDILVDQADAQGRSQLRVITNSPSFNIAAVLKQIDPSITITAASKYQVEIAPGRAGVNWNAPKTWIAIAAGAVAIMLIFIAMIKLLRGTK